MFSPLFTASCQNAGLQLPAGTDAALGLECSHELARGISGLSDVTNHIFLELCI